MEGFNSLITFNGGANSTNYAIQSLKNSLSYLGNSWAAAFAPIIEFVAPILNRLIDILVRAANAVGAFFAILTGKGTIMKAVKQQTALGGAAGGAAKKLKEEGDQAKKTVDRLAGFDDLDVLGKDDDSLLDDLADDLGGGAGGIADMFEEIELDRGWIDDLLQPLLEAWAEAGEHLVNSWKSAFEEIRKLLLDIGRDLLIVWNQEATIKMLSEILYIIGDIGQAVGNLAKALRIAWDTNELGKRMFEDIRNLLGIIIHNIHKMSEATKRWSQNLDFIPIFTAFEKLLDSLKPTIDTLSGILADFYTDYILPLTTFTIEEGLPKLFDILEQMNSSINWGNIRSSIKELVGELEKLAELSFTRTLEFVDKFLKPIAQWVMNDAIPKLVQALTQLVKNIDWKKLNGALKTLYEVLSNFVIGIGQGLINFISNILKSKAVSGIINAIAEALKKIGDVLKKIPVNGLTALTEGILTFITITKGLPLVVGILFKLGNAVQAVLTVLGAIGPTLTTVLTTLPGIITLAAGIISLLVALESMGQAMTEAREIEMFGDTLDNLTLKMENNIEASQRRIDQAREFAENAGVAEAEMATDLADRYFALAEKENLTNEERLEMRYLQERLLELYPELNQYIDEEGVLQLQSRDAVYEYIQAKLKQYEIEAYEEYIKTLYQEKITQQQELTNQINHGKGALEEFNKAQAEVTKIEGVRELWNEYRSLQIEINQGTLTQEELNKKSERMAQLEKEIEANGFSLDGGWEQFSDAIEHAKENMDTAKDGVKQFEENILKAQEAYGTTEGKIAEATEHIQELLTKETFVSSGRNIPEGINEGELEGLPEVVTTAGDMAEDILKKIREVLDAHSPSRKGEELGEWLDEGIAFGITNNEELVLTAVTQLAQNITSTLQEALSTALSDFSILADSIAFGVEQLFSENISILVTEGTILLMETVSTTVNTGMTTISTTVTTILTTLLTTITTKVITSITTLFTNLTTRLNAFITMVISRMTSLLQIFQEKTQLATTHITNMSNKMVSELRKVYEMVVKIIAALAEMSSAMSGMGLSVGSLGSINVPHLAKGAVIPPNNKFLAMLGDQTSGTNIEAPLDTIVDAFKQVVGNMQVENTGYSEMQLDVEVFARLITPYVISELNREGYNVEVLEA